MGILCYTCRLLPTQPGAGRAQDAGDLLWLLAIQRHALSWARDSYPCALEHAPLRGRVFLLRRNFAGQ